MWFYYITTKIKCLLLCSKSMASMLYTVSVYVSTVVSWILRNVKGSSDFSNALVLFYIFQNSSQVQCKLNELSLIFQASK